MGASTGGMAINFNTGKKSLLVVDDPEGRFTRKTKVEGNKAVDIDNSSVDDFQATTHWVGDAARIVIRLKSNGPRRRPPGVATDPVPPTGTLSVTLTDLTDPSAPVTIPVNPVPVVYVDDDETNP
jgi:hypothetical protein